MTTPGPMAVSRGVLCSEWTSWQPHQNHLECMGEEAVPNRKKWRTDKKWKLSTVPSTTPASSSATPYSAAPQMDAISQNRPLQDSLLHTLSEMTSPVLLLYSSIKTGSWSSLQSDVWHPSLTPASLVTTTKEVLHSNWALRLHLRPKQKWALCSCYSGHTCNWELAGLGTACNVSCQQRYKMPSCARQTSVPESSSSPSHRDWVGERAARSWLPTKLQLAPKLSPASRVQGFLTKICWKMDSQCFCLFT